MSQLIVETFNDVTNNIISESVNGQVQKKYFIEGNYLSADIKNGNGRIYPKPVIEKEVKRLNETLIPQRQFLGELNHPDSVEVNLERVSHLITELKMSGNYAIGKSLVVDSPCGKIVKSLLESGVKIGVSSRGIGTLKESIVQPDFCLHAIDVVSTPSGTNCFVDLVMEDKEWVLSNGVLTEQRKEEVIKEVEKVILEHQFSIEDRQAAFLKIFTDTMNKISNKYR